MRPGYWLVGIALAACAQATPTLAPEPARVAVTDLAAPLVADLVATYRSVGATPSVSVIPLSSLTDELQAGRVVLAVTASPSPEHFATPIALASFAVVVHPRNPVARLSLAQVRAIFAGEVVDWAQVGGGSGVMVVVTREPNSDGALAFASAAGIEVAPPASARLAPTWAAMRELVAESPGAIGFVPVPELSGEVKVVELDAELRALLVATALSEPTGPARDFLAWAQSEAGQRVVAQRFERVK